LKKSSGYPINVYREECADGPADLQEQAVALPRDVIQVRNFQKNEKRKMAITQDTNYNLQEIANDTKFIREIISYPDVAIFMYSVMAIACRTIKSERFTLHYFVG
jgi:hypothetical protein